MLFFLINCFAFFHNTFQVFDYKVLMVGATTLLSVSSMLKHILGTLKIYEKPILDFSIFLKVQIDL